MGPRVAFGLHFGSHFGLHFHTCSDLPKTLKFNDLTLLFDVFGILKALILGYFLGPVFGTDFGPLQKLVFERPGPPLGDNKDLC